MLRLPSPPCVAAILLALTLGVAPTAHAHATRAVSIDLQELSDGTALVHIRRQVPGDAVDVAVASPCRFAPLDGEDTSEPLQRSRQLTCPRTVAGAVLTFPGLGPIVTEAIVVYTLVDGRAGSAVARGADARFEIPAASTRLDVARSYIGSGVAHILEGYDHLLFLLLLVLNLRTVASVLLAETAFTLSHSLSFSATALGWIRVSPLAAEACIALSLVLMALEVRRGEPGERGRGALLAFAFGLVHGLGFAGALAELGVPERDAAVALLGFAGGVEIGQVLFLSGVLAAIALVSSLLHAGVWRRLETVMVSVVGGVATFWLIERVVAVVAARG